MFSTIFMSYREITFFVSFSCSLSLLVVASHTLLAWVSVLVYLLHFGISPLQYWHPKGLG